MPWFHDDYHSKRIIPLQTSTVWNKNSSSNLPKSNGSNNGINGILVYLNDILVIGATREEHEERLKECLQRLSDRGFQFNLTKCKFYTNEVHFLGLIVNADGIRTNSERTRAIANLPAPTNIAKVRSLLGMVNHYGKFVPTQYKTTLGESY